MNKKRLRFYNIRYLKVLETISIKLIVTATELDFRRIHFYDWLIVIICG